MTETVFMLILAYVALAALLAIALIATQLPVAVKLGLVLVTSALYFVSYQAWQSVQGWAAPAPLPERFLLHASVIHEPDKTSGSAGMIYIWASDLTSGKPADEPRAYSLDYEKELHADLEDALRNMRNGIIQLGRVTDTADQYERPTDFTRMGARRQKIEIYALPDPALPEK